MIIMHQERTVIGIDFGSSQSFVSELRIGSAEMPQLLKLDGDQCKIPTKIAYDIENKKIIACGIEAEEKAENSPEDNVVVVKNFKRYLGEKMPEDAGVGISGIEAKVFCKAFIEYLSQRLKLYYNENSLSSDRFSSCFACPAMWNDQQKETLKKLAHDAGFPDIHLLTEPEAAVHAQRVGDFTFANKSEYCMVIDFGGGTLDVCILKLGINGLTPKIITATGNPKLGGYDFDNIICRRFFKEARIKEETLSTKERMMLDKMSEDAKIIYSQNFANSNNSEVSYHFQMRDGYTLRMRRSDLENIFDNQRIITKIEDSLNDALSNGELSETEIDKVILTGGSSQWFFMKDIASKKFGIGIKRDEIYISRNSFHDVSIGCAVYIGRTSEPSMSPGYWVKVRKDNDSKWGDSKCLIEPRKEGAPFPEDEKTFIMAFETSKLKRRRLHLRLYKGIDKNSLQEAGDEFILDIWTRSNNTWTGRLLAGLSQTFGKGKRTQINDIYNLYITCKESHVSGEPEFYFELYDSLATEKEKSKHRDGKDTDKMPDGKVQRGQLMPGYTSSISFFGFGSRTLEKN